jgi:toxin ParE1/3/4
MSDKPVIRRELADEDVNDAIAYYENLSEPATLGFINELERSYKLISAQPGIGSPRYGYELELPGLLFQKLDRYPYIVFYCEQEDHIDIWRVLHERRDIPAHLH